MKIVADDKIPYIQPALQALADEVVFKAGKEITSSDVRDADILVVRTRTCCDRRLLKNSSVRLVVTATIGYDHFDTKWLEKAGILWANCPGCNATSVAQYVRNSLFALQQDRDFVLTNATVGIVGVGHVGTAVLHALRQAGVRRILLNDPPREVASDPAPESLCWSPIETLQAEADVITLHTPLMMQGAFKTYHLVNAAFFDSLQRTPVLINTARGGIVDEVALCHALDNSLIREAIIDTWEHEPQVRRSLLQKAYLSTPHIAGYSADGKANATRMALDHICNFLGQPMTFDIHPPTLPAEFHLTGTPDEQALQLYDPRRDSQQLKMRPESFEQLRGNYPLRREECSFFAH